MKWVGKMFIKNREKSILELLLKMGGKHTAISMSTYLHVSVRTINRDLKNIDKILAHYGLQIKKDHDNSISLEGPNKSIFKLTQDLSKIVPLDLSVEQIKLLLLLKLLDQKEPVKLSSLARDLNVSVTTLSNYLDDLSELFTSFDIELIRKRSYGIQLIGEKSSKRKALGQFFLLYFNEQLIESIFQLSSEKLAANDLILHYFKMPYLIDIQNVVNMKLDEENIELVDSDYMAFIMQVCITFQRIESGFYVTEEIKSEDGQLANQRNAYIDKLSEVFHHKYALTLDDNEKNYLIMILKGSKTQRSEAVFYDSVITGRAVKNLIQCVSKQYHLDLMNDFTLFQGLMAHIEPSLFRIKKNMGIYNPMTDQIKRQYPILFNTIKHYLGFVFKDLQFPDDEIAYIVLHFGSVLELRRTTILVRTLVVCPTGIGSSKMLVTRLKKEIPYLSSVEVSSIQDLKDINVNQFDMILSTVHLPIKDKPYIYVNPLLSKEDVKNIELYVQEHVEQMRLAAATTENIESTQLNHSTYESGLLENLMDDMYELQYNIRLLLKHTRVYEISTTEDYQSCLLSMVDQCVSDGILDDRDTVFRKLLDREQQAGLGIPDTNMALFHCKDKSVKSLVFHIGHLNRDYTLIGMDGKPMPIQNLMLLLAPEKLTPLQLEIISNVSSSIVEDRESTLIYSSANEKMIQSKLEQSFYTFIKNKMMRE
ncbi:PRD domain-containing protein [Terrilactibacillus sp. BCM23-1]|uniref:PRD domain-containing protein n=1 Tax=Terrilactibacillus tamarindi TaxID=2599694 RepID=A0A6N8CQR1_9BACI|nr:PRD domain-containing protein [Terrilactibacillus tamarindi]MTT32569.1 PRD domain-containing protein [Terrilactibacillus tamarindi]